jgi:hypothetical protein
LRALAFDIALRKSKKKKSNRDFSEKRIERKWHRSQPINSLRSGKSRAPCQNPGPLASLRYSASERKGILKSCCVAPGRFAALPLSSLAGMLMQRQFCSGMEAVPLTLLAAGISVAISISRPASRRASAQARACRSRRVCDRPANRYDVIAAEHSVQRWMSSPLLKGGRGGRGQASRQAGRQEA